MDKMEEELKAADEMLEKLMEYAFTEKNSEFVFIRSLEQLKAAKECLKTQKKVVKGFRSIKTLAEKFIKQAFEDGKDIIDLSMFYEEIKFCDEFFAAEMKVLKDMIKEYRCYLRYGHWLDALLGKVRPEEHLKDWRKLPLSWN